MCSRLIVMKILRTNARGHLEDLAELTSGRRNYVAFASRLEHKMEVWTEAVKVVSS